MQTNEDSGANRHLVSYSALYLIYVKKYMPFYDDFFKIPVLFVQFLKVFPRPSTSRALLVASW